MMQSLHRQSELGEDGEEGVLRVSFGHDGLVDPRRKKLLLSSDRNLVLSFEEEGDAFAAVEMWSSKGPCNVVGKTIVVLDLFVFTLLYGLVLFLPGRICVFWG